ncbi:MAG: very short patch repair endonuclease [Anaerolineae bacterium]|nr:very short patch repair endonuclease [Anaerolineae bacterium]
MAETEMDDVQDPLTTEERSERMARVRSKGNKSTELLVEQKLIAFNLQGWIKHPKGIIGNPDFYFPDVSLVLFVDGCFWHSCPKCNRNTPHSRRDYWQSKIDTNRRRDNRNHRKLRQEGYHVVRVWEHELKRDTWIKRLRAIIARVEKNG